MRYGRCPARITPNNLLISEKEGRFFRKQLQETFLFVMIFIS